MKKLLETIQNWLRGGADTVVKTLQNPVRDGQIAIENARDQIDDLNTQLAQLLTSTEKLKLQQRDENEEAEKFEKIAKLAGSKGEADDVRSALSKKGAALSKVSFYQKQIQANVGLETQIRAKANDLLDHVKEAETNYDFLSTSVEFNKLRENIAKVAASPTSTTGLDSLKEAAQVQEAKANAWEQIAGETDSDEALEQKYNVSDSGVSDDEVSKYLKK